MSSFTVISDKSTGNFMLMGGPDNAVLSWDDQDWREVSWCVEGGTLRDLEAMPTMAVVFTSRASAEVAAFAMEQYNYFVTAVQGYRAAVANA